MAITFKVYHDSALTTPVTAGDPIAATFDGAGSSDVQLWFGSTTSSVKVQVTSNPGVTPITLTPTDAASGSGQPATAIKLATTQGALASATAGAALSIGATVTSGTANAFSFWVRLTNALTVVGAYTDLTLETPALTESAV